MNQETRVLIVEDTATDAELIERELRKAKIVFSSKRVETKDAFLRELDEFAPDIILSDYKLPQLSGLEALRLLKERKSAIPFILVTGSLTEEVVVECMKEGADDYILKTSLRRLPSAVLNALQKIETERAKEEAIIALGRSEERYRLITENTRDLICMLDMKGYFTYVSPSFKQALGYAPEDLVGQSSFALIHPDDKADVAKKFLEALSHKDEYATEFRYKHRSGEWRTFETVRSWVLDEQGNMQSAVIVARDITERKQVEQALIESEERLQQSQKLEAVGQLAGGVAHDFNNLLTVITGYSDLILRSSNQDDSTYSKVKEIKRAAERAAALTHQLLAFSRKQVLQPQVLDLNSLVTDTSKMLQRLIGENIELETALASTLGQIKADYGQIEQVIMNLVVNARDAMPQGGKLTIETVNVYLDQTYARQHIAVQPGTYAMLAVSDTGCGMDAETQPHIFEPFFTTKELGKGTGLGLSTVYGIIKQSGGNIWVYSEVGRGTTFKIYLPLTDEAVVSHDSDNVHAATTRGSETILLVEDEEAVRELLIDILEMDGYEVLKAANGNEALQTCQSYEGTIHLMLTDVVMPRMGGRELAERASVLRPEMRVLYMSGYTDDAIVHHGVLDPGIAFLEKPFTPDAVARKVREALDAPAKSLKRGESGTKSEISDDRRTEDVAYAG